MRSGAFEVKKRVFAASSYVPTKQIAEAMDWTTADMSERQSSNGRRFYAVLHRGGIRSPLDAVRALLWWREGGGDEVYSRCARLCCSAPGFISACIAGRDFDSLRTKGGLPACGIHWWLRELQ
jgi:hypothetical protein